MALRGDIPENKELQKHDFNYASDLVEFIKHKTNLSIGVAGYPEGHIESPDLDTDINYLKDKVDKGADAIFTQLFFDNNNFYKFIDKTGLPCITQFQLLPPKSESCLKQDNGSILLL